MENGCAAVFELDRKPLCIDNDLQAGCQANKIIRIGKRIGFVKIIYTPTKSALDVSPCTETIDVQIADCENLRRGAKIATHRWPQLSPSVKCSSEEAKWGFLHLFVLRSKIR